MSSIMHAIVLSTVLTALPAASGVLSDEHPVLLDRTGIAWQIPFDAARGRAMETKRLIAIKPVAFGTTADGCW